MIWPLQGWSNTEDPHDLPLLGHFPASSTVRFSPMLGPESGKTQVADHGPLAFPNKLCRSGPEGPHLIFL